MICHLTLTQIFTITFYHKAIRSAIEKAAIVINYSSLLPFLFLISCCKIHDRCKLSVICPCFHIRSCNTNNSFECLLKEEVSCYVRCNHHIAASPKRIICRKRFRFCYIETTDRKSTRLNSSHVKRSRMPSSA